MKKIKTWTLTVLFTVTPSLQCSESLPLTQNMLLYNTASFFNDPGVLKKVEEMIQAETNRTNESIHLMRVRNYFGASLIAAWIIWASIYGPEEKCKQCKALRDSKNKNPFSKQTTQLKETI